VIQPQPEPKPVDARPRPSASRFPTGADSATSRAIDAAGQAQTAVTVRGFRIAKRKR
jgi:hypothetical protein